MSQVFRRRKRTSHTAMGREYKSKSRRGRRKKKYPLGKRVSRNFQSSTQGSSLAKSREIKAQKLKGGKGKLILLCEFVGQCFNGLGNRGC